MPRVGSLLGERYLQKDEADENHGRRVTRRNTIESGRRSRRKSSPDVLTTTNKKTRQKHVCEFSLHSLVGLIPHSCPTEKTSSSALGSHEERGRAKVHCGGKVTHSLW